MKSIEERLSTGRIDWTAAFLNQLDELDPEESIGFRGIDWIQKNQSIARWINQIDMIGQIDCG